MARLSEAEQGYEELRVALRCSVRTLDDDLHHVDRSLRGSGRRMSIEPARCAGCGFVFRNRAPRHWHPPSRCPRCRGDDIREPRFRIEGGPPS